MADLIFCNDALSRWLFSGDTSQPYVFTEGVTKSKKKGVPPAKVETRISARMNGGQLQPFDSAVLTAATSIFEGGNDIFSIHKIFETLGGGNHLTPAMKKKIAESIDRLRQCDISVRQGSAAERYHRGGDKRAIEIKGALLPCEVITAEINGAIVEGAIRMH